MKNKPKLLYSEAHVFNSSTGGKDRQTPGAHWRGNLAYETSVPVRETASKTKQTVPKEHHLRLTSDIWPPYTNMYTYLHIKSHIQIIYS